MIASIPTLNYLGAILCLGCYIAFVDAAHTQGAVNSQCSSGDEFTLRIEYTIDDQYVAKGLHDIGAPTSVRGDERRLILMRGDSIWERVTGTTWVEDKDAERLQAEMEALLEEIDQTGGEGTPAQRMRLFTMFSKDRPIIGEARPTDWIRVEVRPPGWSFGYNNVSRLGSKYQKTAALTNTERGVAATSLLIGGIVRQQVQDAEIDTAGERLIAGHRCEVTIVTRPVNLEYCTTEIDGREIDLYLRTGQPDNMARTETAEVVEVDACIDETRFDPPDEVELVTR